MRGEFSDTKGQLSDLLDGLSRLSDIVDRLVEAEKDREKARGRGKGGGSVKGKTFRVVGEIASYDGHLRGTRPIA